MFNIFVILFFVIFCSTTIFPQQIPDNTNQTSYQLENIQKDLGQISKSVNELNVILKISPPHFQANRVCV